MNKKTSYSQKIILGILICGILFIWPIWWIVHPFMGDYVNDNRQADAFPKMSLSSYADYSSNLEEYISYKLPFRSFLVTLNSRIDYYVFGESSNNSVIIGKDDWLYFSDTVEDYQRMNLYDEEELAVLAEEAQNVKDYCDEHGIIFVLIIPPNKNTIYPQYMPERIDVEAGMSRAEQYTAYLREHTDVTVCYPVDELRGMAASGERLCYMKQDSHWNNLGAYIGTRAVLGWLGIITPSPDDLSYEDTEESVFADGGHDLANSLGLDTVLDADDNYLLSGYADAVVVKNIEYVGDYYDSVRDIIDDEDIEGSLYRMDERYRGINSYGDDVYSSSNASDKRSVLLIRDSFGEIMMQYLACEFALVTGVRNSVATPDMIEETAPDILIYEMVERSDYHDLGRLIEDR